MTSGTLIHNAAINCIAMSGLPTMARWMQSREMCIFMFHGFTDTDHSGLENAGHLHMQIAQFDALSELLAKKYNVLSLTDLVDTISQGKPLPPNSVVLTFDDGYASNYHLAFPILRKHELPATIFVATEFVDRNAWLWPDRLEYALGNTESRSLSIATRGDGECHFPLADLQERRLAANALQDILKSIPQEELHRRVEEIEFALGCSLSQCATPPEVYRNLNWEQIREMQGSGLVTIGAHTHTHRIVGRCTAETARDEISTGKALIEANTGRTPDLFAYPNGKPGDHTAATRELLIEMGFRCAVTTETGFNNSKSDLLTLRRYGNSENRRHMDAIASGALQLIGQVKSAVARSSKRNLGKET